METAPLSDTKQRILAAARLIVQDSGYNALSFRELAKEIGVKSASIHHHFPTKGDLGALLAQRYTADFAEYLDSLLTEPSLDTAACIRKYADVFRITLLNGNRMCLGGMLSAEHNELPVEVQAEVGKFSDMNIRWLGDALSLRREPTPGACEVRQKAIAIFAAIQGAQLVARGRGDVSSYDTILEAYRTAGLIP